MTLLAQRQTQATNASKLLCRVNQGESLESLRGHVASTPGKGFLLPTKAELVYVLKIDNRLQACLVKVVEISFQQRQTIGALTLQVEALRSDQQKFCCMKLACCKMYHLKKIVVLGGFGIFLLAAGLLSLTYAFNAILLKVWSFNSEQISTDDQYNLQHVQMIVGEVAVLFVAFIVYCVKKCNF